MRKLFRNRTYRTMKHKVIQSILFLIFLSFAALQYNDPDPYAWIAIYGAIALISFISVLGKLHREVVIGMLVIVLG